jgi:aminocarboxymuconate-semialdehyde decarboxylase
MSMSIDIDSYASVIDMHAHFVPPSIISAAQNNEDWHGVSFGKSDNGKFFSAAAGKRMALPWKLPLETSTARTATMDRLCVDVQVVSLSPTMHWYTSDPAQAGAFARHANDELAALVQQHPDRYLGLGYLPLQNVPASLRELERCMTELGFIGVMVGTNIGGRDWDDPTLFPVLERATDIGAFVFFHPARGRAADWLDRYHLENLIGNPLETTAAAAALIFGGVIERLPGLRACLAHGGGYCCGNVGRWDHGWRVRQECHAQIGKLPSEYLRMFYFDSLTHSDDALRALVDLVGADHILLGSDYPADMAAANPVGVILASQRLSSNEKLAILGRSMLGILGQDAMKNLSKVAFQNIRREL